MTQRAKQQRLNCVRKQVLKFGYLCTTIKLTKNEISYYANSKKYKFQTFLGVYETLARNRKKKKNEILNIGFIDYITLLKPENHVTPNMNKLYGKMCDMSKKYNNYIN